MCRGFYQPQPHVAWSILNAVKVPSQLSLRGQHHNAVGMRKLVPGGVVGIVEAYRLAQALDSLGRAGEKMPAIDCTGTPVAPHVLCLFRRSQGWSIMRIDAHNEDVKIRTGGQGEGPQGPEQAVEYHSAEVRAVVIDQAENNRLPAKIVLQGHWPAGLVPQHQIERYKLV